MRFGVPALAEKSHSNHGWTWINTDKESDWQVSSWRTGLARITRTLVALALCGPAVVQIPAQQQVEVQRQTTLIDDRHSEPGFQGLFNGRDLTGWDGNPKLWSVKDGVITGQTTVENPAKGNTFLIWTNGTPGDFELRCSFKLVPGDAKGFANSGVQYRSRIFDPANWVVGGYQADMEAGPNYTGILYEERLRGIMALRGEKVVWTKEDKKEVVGSVGKAADIEASLKKGDWNDYVIIAKGNHLQQFVNGKQTIDVTDECEAKRAMSGLIALQLHAGAPMMAQFKNIRIKLLTGP
jgi:3-keto-disaccharide hydrolase